MMPEVQALIAGLSGLEVYPDVLAGHLESILRTSLIQSYQGTWCAMTHSILPVADSPELSNQRLC